MGAQLVMYHGFKAVYFSGYSFAIGHLGTTDMDLYSGPEIADGARRTVCALRKFQLTKAVGDPEKGIAPKHLEIPPVVVDMDGGYGNIFNVQRKTELLVNAGVAAAHLEDQVLPKRCGHIGGKALVPADEMIGKLRMARAVADDLGRRGLRGHRPHRRPLGDRRARADARPRPRDRARPAATSTSGIPDLVWCEFPTSERGPVETFADAGPPALPGGALRVQLVVLVQVVQRPGPDHLRAARRARLQVHLHHARRAARGRPRPLDAARGDGRAPGAGLHRAAAPGVRAAGADFPTRSHHEFSGVPYHHELGKAYDAARLGREFVEDLPEDKVV